eukprot:CAMPEP_0177653732 /NCGR_PEP_ID=MMETSP0447-20121125/13910_1 /TAXON_ID=0 /ORGANISM="Stygamoeba regulata, Strain BSH-02190019" /LENGTH=937 /DNA_ID=CAMNT_0019157243 /DNA_START=413 /DNA_END=3227 /DNA_ORIENTATION=+
MKRANEHKADSDEVAKRLKLASPAGHAAEVQAKALNLLLEHSSDLFCLVNRVGSVLMCTRNFREFYAFCHTNISELLVEDQQSDFLTQLREKSKSWKFSCLSENNTPVSGTAHINGDVVLLSIDGTQKNSGLVSNPMAATHVANLTWNVVECLLQTLGELQTMFLPHNPPEAVPHLFESLSQLEMQTFYADNPAPDAVESRKGEKSPPAGIMKSSTDSRLVEKCFGREGKVGSPADDKEALSSAVASTPRSQQPAASVPASLNSSFVPRRGHSWHSSITDSATSKCSQLFASLRSNMLAIADTCNDFMQLALLEHDYLEGSLESINLAKLMDDVVVVTHLPKINIHVAPDVPSEIILLAPIMLKKVLFTYMCIVAKNEKECNIAIGFVGPPERLRLKFEFLTTGISSTLVEHKLLFESGMKLPLALRMVRLLGGTIGMSRPSSFWFEIPYRKPQSLVETLSQPALPISLLLVERTISSNVLTGLSRLCMSYHVVKDYRSAFLHLQELAEKDADMPVMLLLEDNISPELQEFMFYVNNGGFMNVAAVLCSQEDVSVEAAVKNGLLDVIQCPFDAAVLYKYLKGIVFPKTFPPRKRTLPSTTLGADSAARAHRLVAANNKCPSPTPTRVVPCCADYTPQSQVLIAEDNSVSRKMLGSNVKLLGMKVCFAYDGEEAVNIYKQKHDMIQVILMDMGMPGQVDGLKAVKSIRQFEKANLHKSVPIIAITVGMDTTAVHDSEAEIQACGCNDYIQKPVKLKELRSMLEKQMSQNVDPVPSLKTLCYQKLVEKPSAIDIRPDSPPTLLGLFKHLNGFPISAELLHALRSVHIHSINFMPLKPYMSNYYLRIIQKHHSAQLLELDLSNCEYLTDVGLAYLGRMVELTSLNLQNCLRITDIGLQSLRSLKKLRTLNLTGCTLCTPEGMQYLRDLPNLKFFDYTVRL